MPQKSIKKYIQIQNCSWSTIGQCPFSNFDNQNSKINRCYLKMFFLVHINACNFHKSLIFLFH